MSEDNGEDSLRRSTTRLGDRFAGSQSTEGTEKSGDEKPDGDEPEWVPTTIYLPEETRREFRRFLKRLTLDHPEIEDAQKRELHTALVRTGMEHPEEVAERTEEGP
jgi:hypothetical protein